MLTNCAGVGFAHGPPRPLIGRLGQCSPVPKSGGPSLSHRRGIKAAIQLYTGMPPVHSAMPHRCDHCARSKTKCTREAPACSACKSSGRQCKYTRQMKNKKRLIPEIEQHLFSFKIDDKQQAFVNLTHSQALPTIRDKKWLFAE